MKLYRVTVDEHTSTTFIKRVANWQPISGLDEVLVRLAEYCQEWNQGTPPPAEAIEQQLRDPDQRLLAGGPQFPGLPEARFTLYPSGHQSQLCHTVSIVELGEPVQLQMTSEQGGWACTKPGQTKYHYYTADGKKLCRYEAQPGLLSFWTKTPYGRKTPEDSCSACELAYSRLPKAKRP